jgi:hypothetical protein
LKKLLLLVPLCIALFVGCNKFSVNDAVQETALQAPAADQLALQKIILEYTFMVQTEGLNDEQIRQQYDELLQLLPEEERNALVEMMEQALAQSSSNGNVTAQGVSSR